MEVRTNFQMELKPQVKFLSREDLGAFYLGPCSNLKAREHINIAEWKAAKFVIMTFTKMFPDVKAVDLQMENMVALSYIKKIPTTRLFQDQLRKFGIT